MPGDDREHRKNDADRFDGSASDETDDAEEIEEQIQENKKAGFMIKITALVLLLALIVFSVPNFAYLLSDRLNFLNQSEELSQDKIVLQCRPAVVDIEVSSKEGDRQGTGFNIAPDGLIITNEHVVKNADEITIQFANGAKFYTRKYDAVPGADVAIIKINGKKLPALTLNSSEMAKSGETVTIIGNPLNYERVSQRGMIGRSYTMPKTSYKAFEIGIPVNHGNSGSPVINDHAEVVGIIFAGVNMDSDQGNGSSALAISVLGLPLE